jgi:hypothetical protein
VSVQPAVAGRDTGRAGSTSSALVALVVLGALGALMAVVAWWIGVRTGWGQQLEDYAFEGRKATWYRFRQVGTRAFSAVWVPAALTAAVGAVVVAFRRRGMALAAAAAVVVAVPPVLATWLKRVIDRPDLVELMWANARNSFPSGHAALVASVSLAWVFVVAKRSRAWVAGVSAVATGAGAAAILGTGWHRMSDVVGGVGLAALVAAVVLAVVVWSTGARVLGGGGDERRGATLVEFAIPLGLAILACVAVYWLRNPRSDPAHPMWAFVGSVFAAVFTVSALPLLLALALDRLPRAPRRNP